MTTELEIFNASQSLERAGGNKMLAQELFSMLLKELPELLEKLRHYSENADSVRLKETLHSLNGSIAYCGVPALKSIANKCEIAINHEQPEEHETIVRRVMDEIERLMAISNESSLQALFSSV